MTEPLAMNEGPTDRLIRVAIGLALLSLVVIGPQTVWGFVGLIPLTTGAVGYSPLYGLFGISTCGSPHRLPKHA